WGDLMDQTFEFAKFLLEKVARMNRAWGKRGAKREAGATSTNMLEKGKRKGEVQERKIAAIMKLLEILTRQLMETKVWSVNAIGTRTE
ncbi:hypothetical protein HAX54_039123, partial [Datura stramonium]|nr:hypothetical protein [Datura stramonium]